MLPFMWIGIQLFHIISNFIQDKKTMIIALFRNLHKWISYIIICIRSVYHAESCRICRNLTFLELFILLFLIFYLSNIKFAQVQLGYRHVNPFNVSNA